MVVVAGHRSQENLQFGLLHLEWGRVFCCNEDCCYFNNILDIN